MKIVLGAVAEIFEVLDIEIVDGEPHAHVFAANWHFLSPLTAFCRHSRERGNPGINARHFPWTRVFFGATKTSCYQPRRMTIDEAVAGLAQPRLALTSTSLTWRQPPSL